MFNHLIIVCCHGIWTGGPSLGALESEWLIAPFQHAETPTFIAHIKTGIACLSSDPASILAFSGAPTRSSTRLSEAQSYFDLALANDFWGLSCLDSDASTSRILIEDRALDSYHNVLFSMALFYATFGRWPFRITIVSHGFKKHRLVDQHCVAIGVPLERVSFRGVDPPGSPGSAQGVGQAVDDWAGDPHGRGDKLAGKRAGRNPWGIWQGVFPKGFTGSKGGLLMIGEGVEETLVDDAPRPWTSSLSN